MTEKKGDYFSKLIESFDGLELSNIHERRMSCKPLYDYFQKLTLEVGVRLCGLDRNVLKTCHLKTRWEHIQNCLGYVEDPKPWDILVNETSNIRQKVEHDDYYDPNQQRLKEIRKKAPEFKDWIIRVGRKYYKRSKHFTFKQAFRQQSDRYMIEADWILNQYGEALPFVAKTDYSLELEEYPYQQLKELTKKVRERLNSIEELEDIKRSDLENLIQIVKTVSHLRGKEEVLLRYSICPKCGARIRETERYLGGTPDDPTPTAIYYRVGCEKCDYELNSETIDI